MISFSNRQRKERLDRKLIERIADAALAAVLGRALADRFEVGVTFISDEPMRQMNRQYRGLDTPTDVLSFSYFELPSPYTTKIADHEADLIETLDGDEFDATLGEIVIATPTARRYAQKLALTFPDEIQTLVIHGILHVCGYDHETDAGEMTRIERRLRKRLIEHCAEW
jgi:probable rRNA maturation factor